MKKPVSPLTTVQPDGVNILSTVNLSTLCAMERPFLCVASLMSLKMLCFLELLVAVCAASIFLAVDTDSIFFDLLTCCRLSATFTCRMPCPRCHKQSQCGNLPWFRSLRWLPIPRRAYRGRMKVAEGFLSVIRNMPSCHICWSAKKDGGQRGRKMGYRRRASWLVQASTLPEVGQSS